MGVDCCTIKQAWALYDQCLSDSRVRFLPDAPTVDHLFRTATSRFAGVPAPKAIGDCYLLALCQATGATLVTLDAGLSDLARKSRHKVVLL